MARRVSAESGVTLLELVVLGGIISLLAGIAVSSLSQKLYVTDSAAKEFKGNLRLCRARAVAEGYHYRLRLTSVTAYQVSRMLPGTPWTVDAASARTTNLPGGVQFTAPGAGFPLDYEFDSRGTMISSNNVVSFTLSGLNRTLSVYLWPSGQVS